MKKALAMLLALALVLGGCALAEGNWYVEAGQALALRMQALAADEAYIGLMTTSEEMRSINDEFAQADLSAPTHAWFMAIPDADELVTCIQRLVMVEGDAADLGAFDALSEVGREELIKRLPASASTMLSARGGVRWIAFSSVITVSQAKEEPEDFRPGFLLLEYPGDFAVLVTFGRPLPGYATASAMPVPANSLEEVQPLLDYAEKLGLPLALEELEID